jgi:hypothetical protein
MIRRDQVLVYKAVKTEDLAPPLYRHYRPTATLINQIGEKLSIIYR